MIRAAWAVMALLSVGEAACGESRRPIGDECIRSEDCLSNVCAARVCAAAPSLVSGASNPPDDEEPRIPDDAGSTGIVITDAQGAG